MAVTSSGLWGVDWLPGVGHLGHEPVDMVRRVGGCLDPPVRQGDREGSRDNTVGILGLRLLEVGLAVVVSHAVLIGVRLGWQLLFCRGTVGRGASGNCEGGCQKN